MIDVKIGKPNFRDLIVLQEIKGAGRPLKTSAEHEHAHATDSVLAGSNKMTGHLINGRRRASDHLSDAF